MPDQQPSDQKTRVALVTGGGSGIGRAAALSLGRSGFGVVALVGRREAPLTETADLLREAGAEPIVLQGDVSREADVKQAIGALTSRYGRLDAAFNNAGVEGAFGPVETLSEDDFDATMRVNLKGVWLSCKHEMAAMAATSGSIVNTSSWLAKGAFPGSSIYSASKAALDGMTRALAIEGAGRGIRVNAVNPGIIATPMFDRFGGDDVSPPFVAHTPMRRMGEPEDVGDVVAWLCGDGARFVTGETLLVDGGYTIPGHRSWLAEDVSAT